MMISVLVSNLKKVNFFSPKGICSDLAFSLSLSEHHHPHNSIIIIDLNQQGMKEERHRTGVISLQCTFGLYYCTKFESSLFRNVECHITTKSKQPENVDILY